MVIEGLAEIAERLPDDEWRELRIRIRKGPNGAEVDVIRELAVLLPCPVCGGEAIHAIDILKRTIIRA